MKSSKPANFAAHQSRKSDLERAMRMRLSAEQAMDKCETQLQLILENVPVAIGRCDHAGRFIFVNQLFADCYGLTPPHIAGKLMPEMLGFEEWTRMAPMMEKVRAGQRVEIEHELNVPGRGLRQLRCTVAPEMDAKGKLDGWLIVADDITTRKHARETLERSAMRQEMLSESLAHLLAAKDTENIISTLFPKVARHIGAEAFTNFLLPSGSTELVLHCSAGLSPEMEAALARLPVGASLCGLVAQKQTALIVNDLQSCTDERSAPLRDRGFQAYCGVPLIMGGQLVGTLGFATQRKPAFTPEELDFIELIARYASLVIDRMTTEARMRAEKRQMIASLEDHVQTRTAKLNLTMDELKKEISERRRLEEEILRISEAEQARIGQDLHDDLGQQLAGMAMLAKLLSKSLAQEDHAKANEAAQLSNYLTHSIRSTRQMAKSLFPVELERGGFVMAMQDLAERTQAFTQTTCEVLAEAEFKTERSSEIHLYRIVQESLNNAIKHGKATHIIIECRVVDGRSLVSVTDNGTGFKPDTKSSGMGLHLFRYRARVIGAEVSVGAGPAGGCQVICRLKSQIA